MAVKLIRKNNSDLIDSVYDAAMFHWILGNGILNGAYESCSLRVSSGVLYVASGLISIFGRIAQIPIGQEISIPVSNDTFVYLALTLDEDDSKSSVEFITNQTEFANADEGFPTTPGTYYMYFGKFNNIGTFILYAKLLEPGVAKNALNLLTTGKIGSWNYNEIFDDENGAIRYCSRAQVTAEAKGFIGGEINEVDDDLYMPNRRCYLVRAYTLVSNLNFTLQKGETYSISFNSDINSLPNTCITCSASDDSNYSTNSMISGSASAVNNDISFLVNPNENTLQVAVDKNNKRLLITLSEDASEESVSLSNFSFTLYGY